MAPPASRLQKHWLQTKAAVHLCWEGFKDALQLQRCVRFWVHDPRIFVKTWQCFVLNGLIFLASIALLEWGLAPAARALLQAGLASWGGGAAPRAVAALDAALVAAYNLLWLLPAYVVSLIVNTIWYQEIAELAFEVMQRRAAAEGGPAARRHLGSGPPLALVELAAQEVYRLALFVVFFAQVMAVGFLPYVGWAAGAVMFSWLYAFYCFDYKWSLTQVPLENRIHLFESNWAFMAGFGCVSTLPSLVLPFFWAAALTGVVFPLFILVACESNPTRHMAAVWSSVEKSQPRLRPVRLPIFATSTAITGLLIHRSTTLLSWLVWLWTRSNRPPSMRT